MSFIYSFIDLSVQDRTLEIPIARGFLIIVLSNTAEDDLLVKDTEQSHNTIKN